MGCGEKFLGSNFGLRERFRYSQISEALIYYQANTRDLNVRDRKWMPTCVFRLLSTKLQPPGGTIVTATRGLFSWEEQDSGEWVAEEEHEEDEEAPATEAGGSEGSNESVSADSHDSS